MSEEGVTHMAIGSLAGFTYCGVSTKDTFFVTARSRWSRVTCPDCLAIMAQDQVGDEGQDEIETPLLDELVNEPTLFRAPAESRILHLIVTPEEEAVVSHMRGVRHNQLICQSCKNLEKLDQIRVEFARVKEEFKQLASDAATFGAKWAEEKARADHLQRMLDGGN